MGVLLWATLSVVNLVGHVTDVTPVAFGADIRAVVVRTGSGPITVHGSDRSDIGGQRSVEHGWQVPKIDEHTEGDTLFLTAQCDFSAVFWCNISYSLEVPRGIHVDVQSGAGKVTVSGLDGSVEARAGAGGVEATDCRGELSMITGAGGVHATQLASPLVTVESGAGGVHLEFVAAPTRVSVSSGAGSIDIEVPRDGVVYQVSGNGGHGSRNVDVATAPSADHSMQIQSGAGSTRIHYPS